MSYYKGNLTSNPSTIAVLPEPYYWWEAGALWGAMLDYTYYTGDLSYENTILEALASQAGPEYNYMNPIHYGSTGNDDQAFWGFAVLAAAERNLPQPRDDNPSWLQLAENLWNSMAPRWDKSHCDGGFTWQIFPDNPHGLTYKNSVSNGGFFQISARLARATGNDTYANWATKVWDWSKNVGFISPEWKIFDGADIRDNCNRLNKLTFTYSHGIYMYGAAVMANVTDDPVWVARVSHLIDAAEERFFSLHGVMYEQACEPVNTCNTDMKSFKAYLSRFMWATSKLLPAFTSQIEKLLTPSAIAAAKTCTGGERGTICGQKWYVGGNDGKVDLGHQMCALEIIQGLLAKDAEPLKKSNEIKDVRLGDVRTTSETPTRTSKPSRSTTPSRTAPSISPTRVTLRVHSPSKRTEAMENSNDEEKDAGVSVMVSMVVFTVVVGSTVLLLGL